ncbi:hypothetical protein EDD18DRAFT_1157117, partial [Armillaria luteobubalina]
LEGRGSQITLYIKLNTTFCGRKEGSPWIRTLARSLSRSYLARAVSRSIAIKRQSARMVPLGTGLSSFLESFLPSLSESAHRGAVLNHAKTNCETYGLILHSAEGRKTLLPDGAPQQKRAGVCITVPRLQVQTSYSMSLRSAVMVKGMGRANT